jgi:hypothetical protein
MIIEALYILVCYFLAKGNAKFEKEDKPIPHTEQGLMHCVMALTAGYFVNWWLCPIILLVARIFFVIFLNHYANKPFFYVTNEPKAWIDKREQAIFGKDGKTPFFIYLGFWVACNVALKIL